MSTLWVFLLPLVLAFWPVWRWYLERYADRSDEPVGILALATVMLLVWSRQERRSSGLNLAGVIGATLITVVYCTLWAWEPQAVQALLAIVAIALVVIAFPMAPRLIAGDLMLLSLSLPVVATLNFYLGFPLRVCVAAVASGLLQIAGFPVELSGAELKWGEYLVQVDAPCSGIKLLWFCCYVAAVLASAFRLRAFGAILLVAVAVPAALIGNVMRVTALFFLETGVLGIPADSMMAEWFHQATGVISFLATATLIVLVAQRLKTGWVLAFNRVAGNPAAPYLACRRSEQVAWGMLFLTCLVAGIQPFISVRPEVNPVKTVAFPGWPECFEGRKLKPIRQSEEAVRFQSAFPGEVAVFDAEGQRVILRWVTRETRQVHPSSDCYRALGYDIKWLPAYIGKAQERWNCFAASREKDRLFVRECVFDHNFASVCGDVSSWYWLAITHKTNPPWWVVTVVQRR